MSDDSSCPTSADACVAALLVGATGKVYGFDATPAMVAKARSNALTAGLPHVKIREADMANGAINLAPDKPKVFTELFRIPRPGGYCQCADRVRDPAPILPGPGQESWADCVSGTLAAADVRKLLSVAGFIEVELVGFTSYRTASTTEGAVFRARKPVESELSGG